MTPAVKLFTPFAAAMLLFGVMPDSVLAAPQGKKICKTHSHIGMAKGYDGGAPLYQKAVQAWQDAVVQCDGPLWTKMPKVMVQKCEKIGLIKGKGFLFQCTFKAIPCRWVKTISKSTTSMPH